MSLCKRCDHFFYYVLVGEMEIVLNRCLAAGVSLDDHERGFYDKDGFPAVIECSHFEARRKITVEKDQEKKE